MTQSAEAEQPGSAGRRFARAVLDTHGLWLGVAATATVAAAFLLHQLMAWPPHEDETLALFVGRDSLAGVVDHVTRKRGGAPLHFLIAWVVAHLGFGLGGIRLVSSVFALASLPLVALLASRLAERRAALAATVVLAGTWMFLFHGVYARMYSLFLFLSLASFLMLLRALERGRWAWAPWAAVTLLCVAAHPYGALVLAAQGLYVVLARRDQARAAMVGFGAVIVLGTPFWLTDLVLAQRFDVGVGGGGAKLGGPDAIAVYLWHTAGDLSSGRWPILITVLALAIVGLVSTSRDTRLFVLAAVAVPVAAFLVARLGGSTSPESRHLIFVAPLFATLVGAGIVRVTRRAPAVGALIVACLLVAEVNWAWQRTPSLFEWEPDKRQAARAEAEAYLAATSRPDDILFGYEPLFLGAWERNAGFSSIVLPRADAGLALHTLEEQRRPLGRGVWVLDASRRNNLHPRLEIGLAAPTPASAFSTRAFGPFLVVRTTKPVVSPGRYLARAGEVMVLGRSLGIGDADVNLQTVERAVHALRGYRPSSGLRSSDSR